MTNDSPIRKPMKHKDFKPCHLCKKGVMHTGNPLFLRISVDRLGIDRRAVERAHGMELMVGNAFLANVMGADEDLATVLDSNHDIMLCSECADKPLHPYFWFPDEKESEAS